MEDRNIYLYRVSFDKNGVPSVELFYSEEFPAGIIQFKYPDILVTFIDMLRNGEAEWDDEEEKVNFGLKNTVNGDSGKE